MPRCGTISNSKRKIPLSLLQNPNHKRAGSRIEGGAGIVAIQGGDFQTGVLGECFELGRGSQAEGERQQAALEHQAVPVIDFEELVTLRQTRKVFETFRVL